jgi:hypothetical protein
MATTRIPKRYRGLTFDDVWAAIQTNNEQFKELKLFMKENARQQKEEANRTRKENAQRQAEIKLLMKENAQRQAETAREMKETDRQMKDFNKRFGDWTNRLGEIAEYMVLPNLQKKFAKLGLHFISTAQSMKFQDIEHNTSFEVDNILENNEKIMLAEIKTKPTMKDVREHVKQLEKMRVVADMRGDKRKIIGAIAGVVVRDKVKEYILKTGFYLAIPSGETFSITAPEGNPREW